nr:hypothetical protein [Tanacetum cinerariifolium]
DKQISGHAMFSVVSKLKLLKKPLRKLKLAQADLAKRVYDLRHELEEVQTLMVEDSFNVDLRKKEMECLIAYKDALKDDESMLKQRAKVDWLSEGDANTKLFHKTVKGNLNRNRIEYMDDMNGVKFSGQHVGAQFVKHFQSVFGEDKRVDSMVDMSSLFTKRLSSKYGLDPSLEDDDVATKDGGMADEMRSEGDVVEPRNSDMGGALFNDGRILILLGLWSLVNLLRASGRKDLWKELGCHNLVVKDEPWLLMGDFNVILDPSESSARSSCFTLGMVDFRDCLGVIGVEDLVMSGLSFSLVNFIADKKEFLPIVKEVWDKQIS